MEKFITFERLLTLDPNSHTSAFLFGPRGTGKTTWLLTHLEDPIIIDLLYFPDYTALLANPHDLQLRIPPGCTRWIVLDEVQKIPELLNEVHRLIEKHHYRFILTGSSARSLRRKGVNLLAGRALDYKMHPLTCYELQEHFSLTRALQHGLLPSIYTAEDPQHYLETYIATYLREEILQEGLTRNLSEFTRFLQVASFSQGNVLNFTQIAREAGIERRIVSTYFSILSDLLISFELPVFTKKAKRRLVSHSKFYLFDVGVYRVIRPKGPLDSPEDIDGPALETLFLQHLRAINDYYRLGYQLYYWRTSNNQEVDFVVYGEKGLFAFEIKRKRVLAKSDLTGLSAFSTDYPMAKLYLLYGGEHDEYYGNIHAIPYENALWQLREILQTFA